MHIGIITTGEQAKKVYKNIINILFKTIFANIFCLSIQRILRVLQTQYKNIHVSDTNKLLLYAC